MLLFTDQTSKNSIRQKLGLSILLKIRGRVFQIFFRWAFEALRENQKLDREF